MIPMCNDHPGEVVRRALSLAELMESCARLVRSSVGRDPDHVERVANAADNMAYDLEHEYQPNINEDENED